MELTPKQALELWHGVSVAALRREQPDLSARQFALLLQVYLAPPHTVRALARDLAISKPAVSRALDALGRLGFLRRKRDDADRRAGSAHSQGRGVPTRVRRPGGSDGRTAVTADNTGTV